MNFNFRYVSTMGPQFSTPLYFRERDDAVAHHDRTQKLLGDLTGMDSMRVEELDLATGEWIPIT